MNKHINIPYLSFITQNHDMEEVSAKLNSIPQTRILETPWQIYKNKPLVKVAVAHAGHSILLKYEVSELALRAVHKEINQPVFKDSCVEFFIQFNENEGYYNLEFNCAGVCLAGYGKGKPGRVLLPSNLIKKIKMISSIKALLTGQINWKLTLMIPKDVFSRHQFKNFGGLSCKVNFYKCGDDLPEPHFISWTSINAASPDFHLPQFFGTGNFMVNPEPVYT